MFSLFKKKKPIPEPGDLSALQCDMHSHLIPGIDDGSPDVETSVALIEGMIKLGYKKIITTPHLMIDLYPNNRATIMGGYEKLMKELEISIFPLQRLLAFWTIISTACLKKNPAHHQDNLVLVEFSQQVCRWTINKRSLISR